MWLVSSSRTPCSNLKNLFYSCLLIRRQARQTSVVMRGGKSSASGPQSSSFKFSSMVGRRGLAVCPSAPAEPPCDNPSRKKKSSKFVVGIKELPPLSDRYDLRRRPISSVAPLTLSCAFPSKPFNCRRGGSLGRNTFQGYSCAYFEARGPAFVSVRNH